MKKLWIVGLPVVLGALAFGVWAWLSPREWSTRNPEVLALVEHARGELNKLYYRDAAEILEKARAIEPNSFAVRYFLQRAYMGLGRPQEAKEHLEFLKTIPQESLTPRERMLLELLVLRRSGDREAYLTRLREYQAEYPREVELARLLALAYQEVGNAEEAERWGRKTLELDANDALAYNILGYAALARGRWGEAEEQFRKYAFIAPDQANPHDSLGELYLITGRLEEARKELLAAVAANPRFYPTWRHLADLAVLAGEPEAARRAVAELARALDLKDDERAVVEATVLGLLGFFHDDPPLLRVSAAAIRTPKDEWEYFVVHEAAVSEGQWATAEELEGKLEQAVASGAPGTRGFARILPLLRAQRLVAQGHFQEAVAAADAAIAGSSFANVGQAWIKLSGQCFEALALARLGERYRALELLAQVRAVNPRFPLVARVEGSL
ncbi:MAG: tetratricopeptide repeat protein [Thermoanaerobaculum sp.]